MAFRGFQLHQQKTDDRSIGLGYRISQTEDVAKVAFGLATELVRDALNSGVLLRGWGMETKEKTHQLLKLGDKLTGEARQGAVGEVLKWENEISGSIRNYFIQISDILNRLKKLNPPLTSDQLDPYLEAILSDRRATMSALEPLSTVIQKIAALKTQVWFDSTIAPRAF